VVGAVIILVVMFLIGPFVFFVLGAIWSALFGWVTIATVDERAGVSSKGDG
jgi:hypothetical protein